VQQTEGDISHITAKPAAFLQLSNDGGFQQRCCSAQGGLRRRHACFGQFRRAENHPEEPQTGHFKSGDVFYRALPLAPRVLVPAVGDNTTFCHRGAIGKNSLAYVGKSVMRGESIIEKVAGNRNSLNISIQETIQCI